VLLLLLQLGQKVGARGGFLRVLVFVGAMQQQKGNGELLSLAAFSITFSEKLQLQQNKRSRRKRKRKGRRRKKRKNKSSKRTSMVGAWSSATSSP
jgi:hypothetical protein